MLFLFFPETVGNRLKATRAACVKKLAFCHESFTMLARG